MPAGSTPGWVGSAPGSCPARSPTSPAASQPPGGPCATPPRRRSSSRCCPSGSGRRWLLRRGWAQGTSNARLDVLADRAGRRERWRRAVAEARESARALGRRKDGDQDELAATVLAVVHAGAAAELARSAVGPRPTSPGPEP